jgi:predicted dehydrogenase
MALSKVRRALRDLSRSVVKVAQRTAYGPNQSLALASMRRPENVPILRCGVVGYGSIGRIHVDVLRQHPYFGLVAVASRQPEKRLIADKLGCRWFESADAMLASGCIDLIVIATPHWQHSDIAIAALQSGVHVVCEKPLTVTVAQADAVLRAAVESRGLLTVVFQGRFEPLYQRVKALLEGGELGSIQRCEIVETFWRSSAYYRSDVWRATWHGEGGGVVLNQAAHVLDRYLWLCGVPKSVMAFCDTVLHAIDVEDTATAVMRHENGTHGWVHVNTTECPDLSRTVIVCDRGRITVQDGVLRVDRLEESIRGRTEGTQDLFPSIGSRKVSVQEGLIGSPFELLARLYENVALAIAGRQHLLISRTEAAQSVELANAILLSSAKGAAVNFPTDRAAYDSFMRDKLGRTGLPISA